MSSVVINLDNTSHTLTFTISITSTKTSFMQCVTVIVSYFIFWISWSCVGSKITNMPSNNQVQNSDQFQNDK